MTYNAPIATTNRTYLGFVNGEDAYDPREPVMDKEISDFVSLEGLFHNLPQEQLEVLVCLYLGFKPNEIVKILQYPNIVRYYNVSSKLRKLYRERKECALAL
jgi:hypothetical protein